MHWHPVSTVDTKMQGAILEGIFDSSLTPSFNCSAVKCSWDGIFTTLGIVKNCVDVTAQTLATKRCQKGLNGPIVPDTEPLSHNCSLTTPGGIRLISEFVATDHSTVVAVSSLGKLASATNQPSLFYTAAQYKIDRGPDGGDAIPRSETVQECSLSIGAYTWSNVTAEGSKIDFGTPSIVSAELQLRSVAASVNERFVYSHPGIPDLTVARDDLKVMITFLDSQFFNRSLEIGPGAKQNLAVSAAFEAKSGRTFDNLMDRMAQRMTDHIANGPNRQVALGNTFQKVLFVRAGYYWLILPLAVLSATLVLLLITMWQSRASSRVALWKESSLALLYHHIKDSDNPAEDAGYLVSDVWDVKELEELAKRTTVRQQ